MESKLITKHHSETLRIEKAKYTADKGSLHDFYLYAFSGEKIGIAYKNPNTAYNAANILCGNITLESGIIAINEHYLYRESSYQQKGSILKTVCHMISEENKLNNYLSFLENFHLLTHPDSIFVPNKYRYINHIQKALKDFDLPFSLFDNIIDLTPLQQKIAELMMSYLQGIKLIVIYTPNNYLSEKETGILSGYIDKLSSLGVTFFIFDHDIEYLTRNSDRIFVIEHGITSGIFMPDEFSHVRSYFFAEKSKTSFEDIPVFPPVQGNTEQSSLSFRSVYTKSLKDISFKLSPGDIMSIVCSRYNEFNEFRELLFGGLLPVAGTICVHDKPFKSVGMTESISNGMYLFDESATSTMVDDNLSLLDNCYFEITHKAKTPFIPNGYYYSAIRTLESFFEPDQLLEDASALTHYEKAKLVLCKVMLHTPKILVCMNPFAYGEKKELDLVEEMLLRFSQNRMSILILSLKNPSVSNLKMRSFSVSSRGTLTPL